MSGNVVWFKRCVSLFSLFLSVRVDSELDLIKTQQTDLDGMLASMEKIIKQSPLPLSTESQHADHMRTQTYVCVYVCVCCVCVCVCDALTSIIWHILSSVCTYVYVCVILYAYVYMGV